MVLQNAPDTILHSLKPSLSAQISSQRSSEETPYGGFHEATSKLAAPEAVATVLVSETLAVRSSFDVARKGGMSDRSMHNNSETSVHISKSSEKEEMQKSLDGPKGETNQTSSVAFSTSKSHLESEERKSRISPRAAGPKTEAAILRCPNSPIRKSGEDGSIVYWRTWRDEELAWSSSFKSKHGEDPKYVTFEPDEGGFNNIRMALEIVVVFALATGRTLVLPDKYPMYLLGKGGALQEFGDFYDISSWEKYLEVMPMHEYLKKEGLTGGLKNKERPPGNATTFDRQKPLWDYIRRATDVFPVGPDGHVVAFGLPEHVNTSQALHKYHPEADAIIDGRNLLRYGSDLHARKSLHFTSMYNGGKRYLAHFYGFLYFADQKVDAFMKRFVRDHMHYRNDIFCRATKMIDLLRRNASDKNGGYDAIHIRRGDFQFKEARLDIEGIFKAVEDVIDPGSLVYIVTDEKNSTFFDPVRDLYRLRFYEDFYKAAGLEDMDPNLTGMVEQIIASGARTFVGTYFSTFTAFITRMRGYLGRNPGFYYLENFKYALQSPGKNFYASGANFVREWPVAYTNLDLA